MDGRSGGQAEQAQQCDGAGPNRSERCECSSRIDALQAQIAELQAQRREVWHRLNPNDWALPIEPLYALEHAAPLIPMSYDALAQFLARHPVGRAFPKRYRFIRNAAYRRYRMLLASEIRTIRNVVIRAKAKVAA